LSLEVKTSKLLPLEAARGMAAIIVVLFHFICFFLPQYDLSILNDTKSINDLNLIYYSSYGLFNGNLAVIFFFVLSGYVLSLKRINGTYVVINTMIKRYFRFFFPVFFSLLLCYNKLPVEANFLRILNFSLTTFFTGNSELNFVLWTMKYEFFGSILVLFISLCYLNMKYLFIKIASVTTLIVSYVWFFDLINQIIIQYKLIYFLPFLAGFIFTTFPLDKFHLNLPLTLCVFIVAFYFAGYCFPLRSYFWLDNQLIPKNEFTVIIYTISSILFLVIFASHNIISSSFNGKTSSILGFISFPLYLVHSCVLFSVHSQIFIYLKKDNLTIFAAFVALIVISAPLVYIIALFDAWWLSVLAKWQPIRMFMKEKSQS